MHEQKTDDPPTLLLVVAILLASLGSVYLLSQSDNKGTLQEESSTLLKDTGNE